MNLQDKRVKAFVDNVRRTATLCNVRVVLRKQSKLFCNSNPKDKTFGCFYPPYNDKKGCIEIATLRPRSKWVATLAHEFGHMCQWFFNESVWTACDIGKHDAAEIIVEWEAGKDFDDDIVTKAFRAVREIEADADTKALEYIKDWQLPVNTHTYIRESKNYDYSYRMMQVNRKWKYFRRH